MSTRGTQARLRAALGRAGLILRGGFHPEPADGVPALPDGSPARTLMLVGNAGPEMWRAFRAARLALAGRHPLDGWLKPLLREIATEVGAHPIFPSDGPPYAPMQRWAMRAEAVHVSPLGILIHPEFGLWHAYRAAFAFAGRLRLAPRQARPSPCESCAEKPCLTGCPVDAFRSDGFALDDCVGHVAGPRGSDCLGGGCLARRACPVGTAYGYAPPQARFHMAQFLRSQGEEPPSDPTEAA